MAAYMKIMALQRPMNLKQDLIIIIMSPLKTSDYIELTVKKYTHQKLVMEFIKLLVHNLLKMRQGYSGCLGMGCMKSSIECGGGETSYGY